MNWDNRKTRNIYIINQSYTKNMDIIKLVTSALMSLFMIGIFAFVVFPALGEATGQNMTIFILALILMGVGVVIATIKAIMRVFE